MHLNSTSIIVAAATVLLGCTLLKGINPIDKTIEALISVLYRMAALKAAVARTADVAYLRLKREYRNSINDISTQRAALHRAEEARTASLAPRSEAQQLKLVVN